MNEAVFTLFNRRTFFLLQKIRCVRVVRMQVLLHSRGGAQCPKTGRENVRGEKCSEGNVRHIQYATPSKIVPFTGEDPGLRLIHSSLSPLEPSRRTTTRAVHPFLYFFSFAVLSNKQTHRPRNIGSNRPHLRALSAILSRKNIRSKTRNKTACATSAS